MLESSLREDQRDFFKIVIQSDYDLPPVKNTATNAAIERAYFAKTLREDQLELVFLHFIKGLTQKEIAKILNVKQQTIATQIKRIKVKLLKNCKR